MRRGAVAVGRWVVQSVVAFAVITWALLGWGSATLPGARSDVQLALWHRDRQLRADWRASTSGPALAVEVETEGSIDSVVRSGSGVVLGTAFGPLPWDPTERQCTALLSRIVQRAVGSVGSEPTRVSIDVIGVWFARPFAIWRATPLAKGRTTQMGCYVHWASLLLLALVSSAVVPLARGGMTLGRHLGSPRRDAGRCRYCSYEPFAEAGVCPECGTASVPGTLLSPD